MDIIAIILGALAFVLALGCLLYSVHVAVVYKTFNDGVKDWAESLDVSTRNAIDLSARNILRELDSKISAIDKDSNDLNSNEDE